MKPLLPLLAIPIGAAAGMFVAHALTFMQPQDHRNATFLLKIDHGAPLQEHLWETAARLEETLSSDGISASFEVHRGPVLRVRVPPELLRRARESIARSEPTLKPSPSGQMDFRPVPQQIERLQSRIPDDVARILRERLVEFGIPSPRLQVVRQSVWLTLPKLSADDINAVRGVVTKRGRLEIRWIDDNSDTLERIAQMARSEGIAVRRDTFNGLSRGRVPYVEISSANRARLKAHLDQATKRVAVAQHREILIGPDTDSSGKPIQVAYLVHRGASLTGASIALAVVQYDVNDKPEVGVVLTAEAARTFVSLTESHVGWRLGIVMDGEVLGAPIIQSRIESGRLRITMTQTPDVLRECQDLVAHLATGGLPAPVYIESSTVR